MSDYVYESGISTKRRRQRRTAVTLLLTLLFLFGAFWWAWSYIRDDGGGVAAGTAPTASPTAPATPTATCVAANDPKTVTINVYNATNRSGLARSSADQLEGAGFTLGSVANDPEAQQVEAALQLRHGPEAEPFATAFKEYYQPTVELVPVEREGTALDLVLGNAFEDLAAFPDLPPC
ncbi:MAG: LytR C-terminal domain-containing protein [Dermatophilaceae bacterium]|nr:LytR C-terminal domain-containing protein [Intrasporangiaceae bacterium]